MLWSKTAMDPPLIPSKSLLEESMKWRKQGDKTPPFKEYFKGMPEGTQLLHCWQELTGPPWVARDAEKCSSCSE